MYRSLVVLCLLALPARGDTPVSVAEFEAYATGKTLTYALGGTVYGAEQYLPGRRVVWAFKGEECREGFWYEEAGQACFVYDPAQGPQCWTFRRDGAGLRAWFSEDPVGAEPALVQESAQPLVCAGPDLGV